MQRAVLSLRATAGWHVVLPRCHAQHHTRCCTSRSAKLIKNPSSLFTKVEKSWQDFLLSEEGGGKAICTVSAFCCHIDPENTMFCSESPLDVVAEPRHGERKGAGRWAPWGACR